MPYGTEALGALRIEKGHAAGPELDGRTSLADMGLSRMASTKKPFIGSALMQREGTLDAKRPQLIGLETADNRGLPVDLDAVGAMLARGELGIECLSEEALSDPRLRQAMHKVEMRQVDALDSKEAPEGARVTLVTKDGAEFSGYLGEPMGMPGNPMSDADLHEKFLRCAAIGGLARAKADALLRHLVGIESALPPLCG